MVEWVVWEVSVIELDCILFVLMCYSVGMMLGNYLIGLFGFVVFYVYGYIGFINNFCWVDLERMILVVLLIFGNFVLGSYFYCLVNLLIIIFRCCKKVFKY